MALWCLFSRKGIFSRLLVLLLMDLLIVLFRFSFSVSYLGSLWTMRFFSSLVSVRSGCARGIIAPQWLLVWKKLGVPLRAQPSCLESSPVPLLRPLSLLPRNWV